MKHDKSHVHCYSCQKFGHYASECKTPNNKVKDKTNHVEEKAEKNRIVLLAYLDNYGDQENT